MIYQWTVRSYGMCMRQHYRSMLVDILEIRSFFFPCESVVQYTFPSNLIHFHRRNVQRFQRLFFLYLCDQYILRKRVCKRYFSCEMLNVTDSIAASTKTNFAAILSYLCVTDVYCDPIIHGAWWLKFTVTFMRQLARPAFRPCWHFKRFLPSQEIR